MDVDDINTSGEEGTKHSDDSSANFSNSVQPPGSSGSISPNTSPHTNPDRSGKHPS